MWEVYAGPEKTLMGSFENQADAAALATQLVQQGSLRVIVQVPAGVLPANAQPKTSGTTTIA